MLHKALEQFVTDVFWGRARPTCHRHAARHRRRVASMSQLLPVAEVVIVTTPQPAAQRVAQRAAVMARQVNLPSIGVIENMSWFIGDDGVRYEIFGAGGGEQLAALLEVPLLGQLPLVPAVPRRRRSGRTGRRQRSGRHRGAGARRNRVTAPRAAYDAGAFPELRITGRGDALASGAESPPSRAVTPAPDPTPTDEARYGARTERSAGTTPDRAGATGPSGPDH